MCIQIPCVVLQCKYIEAVRIMFDFITEFDFAILDLIYQNIRCDFLDPVFAGITHFADAGIGWIILGILLLIPKKTRLWGAMALTAMVFSLTIGELVVKNLVCRVRPYDAYQLFHGVPLPFALNAGTESSFSFPSGHTGCSFASAVVYFIGSKKWGTAPLVFAGLVGFSRLYNYVHFPTDVVAGAILGTLCVIFTVWLYKKYKIDEKLKIRQKMPE